MTAEVKWQLDKAKVDMDVASGGAVERTKGRCINTNDPGRFRRQVEGDIAGCGGHDGQRQGTQVVVSNTNDLECGHCKRSWYRGCRRPRWMTKATVVSNTNDHGHVEGG